MRVKLLISLIPVLGVQLLLAQIPQTISYQGVLRNPSTGDLYDGYYDLTFRLYDASVGGTQWWSEAHVGVPVAGGIFNVILGSITTFISTDPKTKFEIPYWLEIAVGASTLSDRIELTSVPYANRSRGVQGYTNVFPSTGNVGIGTTTPAAKLHIQSPDLDGIVFTDSITGTYRATLINWETMGAQLNLKDVDGVTQAVIRGYANAAGVQATFTAGNVGIGTASPEANLQVVGNWTLGPSGPPPGGFDSWLSANSGILYEGGGADFAHHFSTYGGGDIAKFGSSIGSGQAPDSKVVIDNWGNVGIGTPTPGKRLHVASPNLDGIILTDAISGKERASLFNLETMGGQLNLNDAGGTIQAVIRGYEYGGVQAYFTAGNVGIGTTTPTVALEVVGTVKADTLQLATPAERWYSIPAPEFDNSGGTKYLQPYHVYTYSSGNWYAPVHLPHGATITGFEFTITDDDSIDASITLYSVYRGNQSATQITTPFSTVGSSATVTYSDLAFSYPVDNQNYTYSVQVYYGYPQNGYDMRINNARIRYTVDQPLP